VGVVVRRFAVGLLLGVALLICLRLLPVIASVLPDGCCACLLAALVIPPLPFWRPAANVDPLFRSSKLRTFLVVVGIFTQ
jgi:hypothetical protein